MRYQWLEFGDRERIVYDAVGRYIVTYYYYQGHADIWDENIPLRNLFHCIPKYTLRLPLYKFKKIVIIYTSGIIL